MLDIALTEKQKKLLKDEFGVSDREGIVALSDDEFDKLYDSLVNIEVEEVVKGKYSVLSERGKTATELVDYLAGPYDDAEADEDMQEEIKAASA
jgi:hypothetical protein